MLNKRLAACVTAAIFALGSASLLPSVSESSAISASAESYGTLNYELVNGSAVITSYIGEGGAVSIPSSINGKKVTAIGENAFFQCDTITEVEIPDTVTVISDNAFMECSAMKKVIIPASVTEIGVCAFSGCSSLVTVKLPDSVKIVREAAFTDCTSLRSLYIPDRQVEFCGEAFLGCTSLKAVSVPENVSRIEDGAFGFVLNDSEEAEYEVVDGFVLKCYSESTAYYYAINNDVPYELLDPLPPVPDDTDDDLTDAETIPGDVNGDLNVNVTDISMAAAFVKGKKSISVGRQKRADVNKDDIVNVTDISLISAHVKGVKVLK